MPPTAGDHYARPTWSTCAPRSSTRSTGRATSCWRTAAPCTCDPMRPDDGDKLQDLYSRLSDESLYLRFFSPVPPPTARQLEQITDDRLRPPLGSLVAELGDDIVAIARYDRTGADEDGSAEVAFTVQDDQHGRGLGTHPARAPRRRRARCRHPPLRGRTMPNNHKMLGVFSDAGFEVSRRFDAGTVEVSFAIETTAESVAVQHDREHRAEARSMAPHARAAHRSRSSARAGGRRRSATRCSATCSAASSPVPSTRCTRRRRRWPACAPTRRSLDVPDQVDLAVVDRPGRIRSGGGRGVRARTACTGLVDHLGRVRRGRRRARGRRARASSRSPAATACA